MRYICDFHIHSKYSRATSKEMEPEALARWAKIKGIQVLGTGDFTHPAWFKELKEKLEPAENGLYKLKITPASQRGELEQFKKVNRNLSLPKARPDRSTPLTAGFACGELVESIEGSDLRFILTAEVSSIYSKKGKTRRIHNIIFAPSFEVVDKINTQLSWIGNLKSDGRPILGLDAKELAKIVLNISAECLIVPAHCWTPWFSIFGSMSGFDSIEECFEEYSKYIYSVETGLSSDPAMNWRLSALDKITLISNSDAHSPPNLGREANVFEISPENLSYNTITDLIKKRKTLLGEFLYTIEFFPEEGKYHYDGHRTCKVLFSPSETKTHNGICPKCKGRLTVGVMNRVEELADRSENFKPPNAVDFKSLVPLEEIIADALGLGKSSKAVEEEYFKLINTFDNEFNILLDVPIGDIEKASSPLIAEGVKRVREGKLKITPGYDGEYGKIKIFTDEERERIAAYSQAAQPTLF